MRKPNPILHMTGYGLVYGLLLGMLYIWAIFMLGEGADIGAILGTAYFAFIFGALPGALMGFLEGIILWFVVRGANPLQDPNLKAKSYGIVGILTFIGMSLLIGGLFGFDLFGGFFNLILVLPVVIATAAALYAVRRYLLKLEVWGNTDKRKIKAQHERLALDSASAESDIPLADWEEEQQQQHR